MNPELSRILDLINSATSIRISSDTEELGKVYCDATEDFKELRKLIARAVTTETFRCAAEIEGLPIIRESDKPFKEFAVNVLRGMKIY